MPPKEETASTMVSTSCARQIAPISRTGFTVPDGVSWWQTEENSNFRPGLQHVADGLRIDGVVVGHLDLDQFPGMARGPEAEALAVFARRKVQDHVVGADQGGSGGFEA